MNFEYRTFLSMNHHMHSSEDVAQVCLVVENNKDTALIPLYCFDNTMHAIANGFTRMDRMINGFLVPLNTRKLDSIDAKLIYDIFANGNNIGRFKYKDREYIVGPGMLYDIGEEKLIVLVCKKVLFKKTDGFLDPTMTEISFLMDPSFFTFGNHPMRKKIINRLDRACYDYKVHVRHLDYLSTTIIHEKSLCYSQEKKIHERAKDLATNVLTNLYLVS